MLKLAAEANPQRSSTADHEGWQRVGSDNMAPLYKPRGLEWLGGHKRDARRNCRKGHNRFQDTLNRLKTWRKFQAEYMS